MRRIWYSFFKLLLILKKALFLSIASMARTGQDRISSSGLSCRSTKEEAVLEMTGGGFGFHEIWGNLIKWINRLDIDTIKNKAGITSETGRKAGTEGGL